MVQLQGAIASPQEPPAVPTGSGRLLRALARTTASGELYPGRRRAAIYGDRRRPASPRHRRIHQVKPALRGHRLPRQWWDVFPQSPFLAVGYAGYFGVQLFFVISGFILALPYLRSADFNAPAPNTRSYYLRRLVRLDPPYIVSLLVAFAVIGLTTSDGAPSFRICGPACSISMARSMAARAGSMACCGRWRWRSSSIFWSRCLRSFSRFGRSGCGEPC